MGKRMRWIVTGAVLLGCAGAAQGRVIYVDDDAVRFQDGTSWSTAFRTLQQALDMAQPGDEIRLAQGTYTPMDAAAPPQEPAPASVAMRMAPGGRRPAPMPN